MRKKYSQRINEINKKRKEPNLVFNNVFSNQINN